MVTPEIIIRCIKGEEWPITGYKSFIQVQDNPLTEKSITFTCPVGHKFTLEQALLKGIFTQGRAQKILDYAKKQKSKYQERDWLVWQASDLLPDEKVVSLNLSCVRCGKTAQRRTGKLALCLECCAAWFNYEKGKAFSLLDKTHGKPHDLLWGSIFDRFLKGLPSLDSSAAEKLLEDCRNIARKSRSKHSIMPKEVNNG